MKSISFSHLKNLLESEENFENEAVNIIIDELSIFKDIYFSTIIDTEDYTTIVVNSENPIKARTDLTSYKFSHATNLIIEPIKRSKGDGLRLAVYDEDGDPFDKDIYIQIRKGGEYNAGVKNELNFADMIQNAKSKTIRFKDKTGKELVLKNVESIRDCSKDPGSRTGNKADVEIITNGKPFRISLKKNNAHKVAGLIKKFASQSYKIGKLVRQYYIDNNLQFGNPKYITIPITNVELYRWCVFGNDMQKEGAVIQSTFTKDDVMKQMNKPVIQVDQIITPDEDDATLMNELPIYLFLSINKRGSVEILYAAIGEFGRRYLRTDLVIPGINDKNGSIVESNDEIEESKTSDYGIYFFHGTHNKDKLLKLNPPSPDNILFVTADIDYANEYAGKTKDNSTNVYLIKLKDNAKLFDTRKEEDFNELKSYPKSVKNILKGGFHEYYAADIFLMFYTITRSYDDAYKVKFDKEEFLKANRATNKNKKFYEELFDTIEFFRKKDKSVFAGSFYESQVKLRKVFCEDLKKAGFQGFVSEESINGQKVDRKVSSPNIIGIFDPKALQSIIPIEIDKKTKAAAMRALGKDENPGRDMYRHKDYNRQNMKINDFLNNYSVKESVQDKKYGIFNGYHIYTDMDENNIFHKCYKIKDFGIKGTMYIVVVSETETEIQYLDLKWNEEKQGYGPETQGDVCTVQVEYVETGTWRKRRHGIGMEEIK